MKKITALLLALILALPGFSSGVCAAGETSVTGGNGGVIFHFSEPAVDVVQQQFDSYQTSAIIYELPLGAVVTIEYTDGSEETGMQVTVYDISSENLKQTEYGMFSYTVTEDYARIASNTETKEEIYVHGTKAELSEEAEEETETEENGVQTDQENEQKTTALFTDVSVSDYFYEPVIWAVNKKITSGTSVTEFSPQEPCTRGQIITFLWRAAGSPEPEYTSAFTDVSASEYYFKAVQWAHEQGIETSGAADKFYPDEPCTRAMAIEFLWHFSGSPALFSDVEFEDVPEGSEYEEAAAWAAAEEITYGTAENKFSPDSICTRAQIVTFLYRALS